MGEEGVPLTGDERALGRRERGRIKWWERGAFSWKGEERAQGREKGHRRVAVGTVRLSDTVEKGEGDKSE